VRSGPGTEFSSSTFLSKGDTIEPLGRSADGDWLLIALDGNGKQSWVFNSTGFMTCNAPVNVLPVTPSHGSIPSGATGRSSLNRSYLRIPLKMRGVR
jgi:hypothetical protein